MRKWCYCASFAIVTLVYFIIGGLHAQRSVNANKINVDFSDPIVINSYDACRYPSFILDPEVTLDELLDATADIATICKDDKACLEKGTQWSVVWSFNGSLMIIQAFNFIALTIGAFWFYPRFFGTICNCCLGCCHFYGIVAALNGAVGPYGIWCGMNVGPVEYKGNQKLNDVAWRRLADLLVCLVLLWMRPAGHDTNESQRS